jgi:hypothetical protein
LNHLARQQLPNPGPIIEDKPTLIKEDAKVEEVQDLTMDEAAIAGAAKE